MSTLNTSAPEAPRPAPVVSPRGLRFYALAVVRGGRTLDGWYTAGPTLADAPESGAVRFATLPQALGAAAGLDAGADRVAVPFEVVLC